MHRMSVMLSLVCLGALSMLAWAQEPPRAPTAEAPPQATLPLTKIVLYASGVGYFQRDGQINGHGQVALRFKVDAVNDLRPLSRRAPDGSASLTASAARNRAPPSDRWGGLAAPLSPAPALQLPSV